jgi:hypothetical protein
MNSYKNCINDFLKNCEELKVFLEKETNSFESDLLFCSAENNTEKQELFLQNKVLSESINFKFLSNREIKLIKIKINELKEIITRNLKTIDNSVSIKNQVLSFFTNSNLDQKKQFYSPNKKIDHSFGLLNTKQVDF